MIIDHQIYRKAFQNYLRTGTPILLSIKKDRPTTHYIWRTRRDNKVRSVHAAREGQVFAWDEPPAGGHPGEDYGCRCTAEPYIPKINEHMSITLSGISDSGRAWTSWDLWLHYLRGRGRGVTLRQIGHLRAITSEYMNQAGLRLKGQIADEARKNIDSAFSDDFYNVYQMRPVVYSIGKTTIGGVFSGSCKETNGSLKISGAFEFYLRDQFADPASIGESRRRLGDDDAPDFEIIDLGGTLYHNIHRPLENYLRGRAGLPSAGSVRLGLIKGTPYSITDNWSGRFEGVVYTDRDKSIYKRNER